MTLYGDLEEGRTTTKCHHNLRVWTDSISWHHVQIAPASSLHLQTSQSRIQLSMKCTAGFSGGFEVSSGKF